MPRGKSPEEERHTIVSQPQKRPYGAMVRVHVQTAGAFGQVEDADIEFATGAFVKLAPARMAPWDGGRKFTLKLEGFPTAAAAEAAGRRLVQAVLWMAVSSDAPLRLDYKSYDPFAVFERMRSEGARLEAYGEAYYQAAMIFDEIKEAYASFTEPDPKLLLSMEIFAGARLEASDRARFLAIVSALEPLADEQPLGESVDRFVASCLAELKTVPDLAAEVRASLEGRVRQLRTESIRQSLQKVESTVPFRTLSHSGLTAVRADEKEYHPNLFGNVLTYLHGCRFGIAVFERLVGDEFNPNVSLELGYMLAMRKPVCLLKDATLRDLPADLMGRIYRGFDPQSPETTIPVQLQSWMREKQLIGDHRTNNDA